MARMCSFLSCLGTGPCGGVRKDMERLWLASDACKVFLYFQA